MTEKKTNIWLPLILSVTLIIGMVFGYKLKDNMGEFAPSFAASNNQYKINELLNLIHSKYVASISIDSLQVKTMDAIIAELDPHSVYISAEKLKDINEELNGNYHGIGVQFNIINDTVNIISVMKDSPAELAGLQTGDKILKVDTVHIAGTKTSENRIKSLVKGEKGSMVNVTIDRDHKSFAVSLQRNSIKSSSIDAAFFIQPGIGFIRISKFSGNAYEEFMEQLEKMKNAGMQKLILDLRDNGGGMLDDAVQIADEFLGGNKKIVSTKGANVAEQIFSAKRPGLFEEGKLVVLINENSASASEVLAGALQDWNRATIVGRRSFGKGLVQEQFTLSDGSAVRLTVARYYTPSGRSIQKPYTKGVDTNYFNEVDKRIKDGEILNDYRNEHTGSPHKLQDGRVFYGGEGISPDLYVPADSIRWLLITKSVNVQQSMTGAALEYYRLNGVALKKMKQMEELRIFMKQDPAIQGLLDTWCVALPSNVNVSKCKEIFYSDFEDMVAWMIWRLDGYYKCSAVKDPAVQKALSILK